jgi:hypothetical protein
MPADPGEVVRSRILALLLSREDVLNETAARWQRFALSQGWSAGDLRQLWEGLTEDLVRRYAAGGADRRRRVRKDVLQTMGVLRDRIVAGLEAGDAGRGS